MRTYILIFLAAVVLLPNLAAAYQVIDTRSVQVTDDTYLFTIKYRLGFEKYQVVAPVGAITAQGSASPYLQYQLLNGAGEQIQGAQTSALILSNAAFSENQYVVERGQAREFIMVSLVTLAADQADTTPTLQVTALPFNLVTADQVVPNGLSQGELSHYQVSGE